MDCGDNKSKLLDVYYVKYSESAIRYKCSIMFFACLSEVKRRRVMHARRNVVEEGYFAARMTSGRTGIGSGQGLIV